MRKWIFSESGRRPHSCRLRPGAWRFTSGHFFERLEDRSLLSVSPVVGYQRVSPAWFEMVSAGDDLRAAVAADVVSAGIAQPYGPLPADSSSDQWIVRLTPAAVQEIESVSEAAVLLNSGGGLEIVRGLGLPGQLLVESPSTSAAAAEASLRGNP